MVRRSAIDAVGLFAEQYRSAADYRFLALLSRAFRANMIAVPCAIKHYGGPGGALAEGHLSLDANEYRYAVKRLPLFDEMFRREAGTDPELERIRGLYLAFAGRTALESGRRADALPHLREAAQAVPGDAEVRKLLRLARLVPSGRLAAACLRYDAQVREIASAWRAGELSAGEIARKAWRRTLRLR
jgi:hypothetical protein